MITEIDSIDTTVCSECGKELKEEEAWIKDDKAYCVPCLYKILEDR